MLRRASLLWWVIGLLCAALAALTWFTYQRDIRDARHRASSGSELAQTACGPIEYILKGSGPAVLMVHGAGGGFDQGADFGAALVARGFQVVAMSRFGYLRTPLPADASATAQADAHACLLDALKIRRAAVIGASAGAPSSMQLAIRHPQRVSALVLLVPAAYVPRPGGAPPMVTPPATPFLFDTALRSDFVFWAAMHVARRTLAEAILATPWPVIESAQPDEQRRVWEVLDHLLPVAPRRLGLLNDAAVTSTLPRYDLGKIIAPTLVISFEDDRFGTYAGARYTAEHVRGARFAGYPAGGHLWVGHREDVESGIANFLKGHAGGH